MKKIIFSFLFLHALAASADAQTGKVTGFVPYTNAGKEVVLFKIAGNNTGGCNSPVASQLTARRFTSSPRTPRSLQPSMRKVTYLSLTRRAAAHGAMLGMLPMFAPALSTANKFIKFARFARPTGKSRRALLAAYSRRFAI